MLHPFLNFLDPKFLDVGGGDLFRRYDFFPFSGRRYGEKEIVELHNDAVVSEFWLYTFGVVLARRGLAEKFA